MVGAVGEGTKLPLLSAKKGEAVSTPLSTTLITCPRPSSTPPLAVSRALPEDCVVATLAQVP